MRPDRDYSSMSDIDIADADTSDWIAVLPLGAHEQHGPHLPFETDTIIANGIACKLAAAVDDAVPITFLPSEPVGYSIEHMDYEGTRTLGFEQAVNRWISIGEKLSGQGIRKLLLLNAHGGNSPLLSIVATELRVRFDMLCVATSWTRFLQPGDVVSEEEREFGIHGGDIETSVMLVFAPESVNMEKTEHFCSFQKELAQHATRLRAYGPHAFGWKMQDLNEKGVTGAACDATREKGEALISCAVAGLVELVKDVHDFDLKKFSG